MQKLSVLHKCPLSLWGKLKCTQYHTKLSSILQMQGKGGLKGKTNLRGWYSRVWLALQQRSVFCEPFVHSLTTGEHSTSNPPHMAVLHLVPH